MNFATFARNACAPVLLALFSTSAFAVCSPGEDGGGGGGCGSGVQACPNSNPSSPEVCIVGAPGPVELRCTAHPGYAYCEAWPQPDGYGQLTYSWTTTGAVGSVVEFDPRDPFHYFSCQAYHQGTVTVTVWHNLASASALATVTCAGFEGPVEPGPSADPLF